MRKVKAVLMAVGIGCIFTVVFFVVFSPVVCSPGPNAGANDAPVRFMTAHACPSVTSQDGVTISFGAIDILTSSASVSNTDDLARALAEAMDIPKHEILKAELMCDGAPPCTDPNAVAVVGPAPGTWFPTRGRTFAVLATGRVADGLQTGTAADAQSPSAEDWAAGEILHGLKNSDDGDLVRLHLQLKAPPQARCFALDYTFYTVDLPSGGDPANVCHSSISDLFTAQVNNPFLMLITVPVTAPVIAPGNIALNPNGDVVQASTMTPSAIYRALNSPEGSNTPGAFPLLQMRQSVSGSEPLDLYLSIQDRGDALADSAVALDNFAWITSTEPGACQPNAGVSGDRDGDGLPDGWETYGVYSSGFDDAPSVDLPALGANPDVKDIFVELDTIYSAHTDLQPRPAAIAAIVDAFANAPVYGNISADAPSLYKGIHLHVDYDPAVPLQRGGASRADILPQAFAGDLCQGHCSASLLPLWRRIDEIKATYFRPERARVFHYGIFAQSLAVCTHELLLANPELCNQVEQISGISRNFDDTSHGASDFVVSLGAPYWYKFGPDPNLWETTRISQQAGTFMHELGHNLGLNHYGIDVGGGVPDDQRIMNKPNHLSVMNYLYQTSGLVTSDPGLRFDYLRYNMAELDENHLMEDDGLRWAAGADNTGTLGVRYTNKRTDGFTETNHSEKIDWDGNGKYTDPTKANINGDFLAYTTYYSKLVAYNEWEKLVFTGGLLNRQHSILHRYIAERTRPCFGPQAAVPLAAYVAIPSGKPILSRKFVTPPAASSATRQAIEELTPARNNLLLPGYRRPNPPRPAPPWSIRDMQSLLDSLHASYPKLAEPIDRLLERVNSP